MALSAGIVGLPNVGKSTLFNALTKSSVPAQNYPFCTIDPHAAITFVPDERLGILKELYQSQEIIPATMTFVDIAGLVKGAAAGQGLGNQFLSHIREVDLIIHVLRCFHDENITHVSGTIDPLADFETIVAELMLKDLESLQKRQAKLESLIKASQQKPKELKELLTEQELLNAVKVAIDRTDAQAVRSLISQSSVQTIPLLCAKKFITVANIAESELENDAWQNNPHYQALVKAFGKDRVIPLCARLEHELSQLSDEERMVMMQAMNVSISGLDRVIRLAYEHLGLITFFTCGPKEIHAWPIRKGITVRQASGEIHSDLEHGFICAEVLNYHDLRAIGSEVKAKTAGKIATQGQEYIVQDGDIIHVRFNV